MIDCVIERMTVLGRGLVFQPVLVTHTCTYNSSNIITLQNIDITDFPSTKKKKKKNIPRERERERGFFFQIDIGIGTYGKDETNTNSVQTSSVSYCSLYCAECHYPLCPLDGQLSFWSCDRW